MGIPHGAMGRAGSPPMPKPEESNFQMQPPQNDFQSFEDTFKSVKKSEEDKGLGNVQPQNEIPFDDQPVGGGRSQPQMMPPSEQPMQVEIVQKIDNNNPDYNTQPMMPEELEMPDGDQENAVMEERDQKFNPPPEDPDVINVDEIQIQPKKQLTFEEMLEKELNEKENSASALPPDDDRVIRKPKKEFLKRTTK